MGVTLVGRGCWPLVGVGPTRKNGRKEKLNNIVIFVLFLQFLSSFQMYNVIVETNDGPLTN